MRHVKEMCVRHVKQICMRYDMSSCDSRDFDAQRKVYTSTATMRKRGWHASLAQEKRFRWKSFTRRGLDERGLDERGLHVVRQRFTYLIPPWGEEIYTSNGNLTPSLSRETLWTYLQTYTAGPEQNRQCLHQTHPAVCYSHTLSPHTYTHTYTRTRTTLTHTHLELSKEEERSSCTPRPPPATFTAALAFWISKKFCCKPVCGCVCPEFRLARKWIEREGKGGRGRGRGKGRG